MLMKLKMRVRNPEDWNTVEDCRTVDELAQAIAWKLEAFDYTASEMYRLLAWAERKLDTIVQTK
jgi:hypothetical protein